MFSAGYDSGWEILFLIVDVNTQDNYNDICKGVWSMCTGLFDGVGGGGTGSINTQRWGLTHHRKQLPNFPNEDALPSRGS